jgi:hypothetical protein
VTLTDYLGPDRLQIAPDVEALLGAEMTERYRTNPHLARDTCQVCGKDTDPAAAPVALAALVIPEAARRPGDPSYVTIPRHATCAESELVLWEGPLPEGLDDVIIRAGAWPMDNGSLRAILLLGFPEAVVYGTGPDRTPTDLITAVHLARGWDLVSRMARPVASADTAAVVWALNPGASDAGPGRLSVINLRHGDAEDYIADAPEWWASAWWTDTVAAQGHVDVYAGPLGPTINGEGLPDYAALHRIAKAHRVTATRAAVRVEGR